MRPNSTERPDWLAERYFDFAAWLEMGLSQRSMYAAEIWHSFDTLAVDRLDKRVRFQMAHGAVDQRLLMELARAKDRRSTRIHRWLINYKPKVDPTWVECDVDWDAVHDAQGGRTMVDRLVSARSTCVEWWRTDIADGWVNSAYVGMLEGYPIRTSPNTNVAVFAPPQQPLGKTSSLVIPNVLAHLGPVVVTSPKNDVRLVTEGTRSLIGRVLIYAPDGGDDVVAQDIEEDSGRHASERTYLHWSPVQECSSWEDALLVADTFIKATGVVGQGGENGAFFAITASQVLAGLMFAANKFVFPMRAVVTIATGHQKDEIRQLANDLHQAGHLLPAAALGGLASMDEGQTLNNILATLGAALQCFQSDRALRLTDNPDFDMAEFASGDDAGEWGAALDTLLEAEGVAPLGLKYRADTIYIEPNDQDIVGPVVATFVKMLRRHVVAAYKRRESRGEEPLPFLLFALDELATIAPIPDLGQHLAIGRQGYFTIGVFQDPDQITERWGASAQKSFLSLFQNIVIMPGVRNEGFLKLVSELMGRDRQNVHSMSMSVDAQGKASHTNNASFELQERLPMEYVYGGHPASSDLMLFLPHGKGGSAWVYATPYWRTPLWQRFLRPRLDRERVSA